jgi:hypothetical protein
MADEKDPIEQVKEELAEDTGEEKTAPESSEEKKEHEKTGEELRALDTKISKLCEDVESWKTETNVALQKMAEDLTSSTRQALESLHQKPQVIQPVNPPAPEPGQEIPSPSPHQENADDRKAAKTKGEPKPSPGKKRRFL